MVGRKRVFLFALAGFAIASAIGGVAVNGGMLLIARALQGVFAALLAPAALSLLSLSFTQPRNGRRPSACSPRSRSPVAPSA
ncbi:hypothetical protein GCM10027614_81800 [Micromonospora vulcania]